MRRHFTVTGFVVHQGKTVLHWHRKLGMWLPPGGHIEPDEDPVQAVLREIWEETSLEAEVLPLYRPLAFARPTQLPPPVTILIEDIAEANNPHQHIDLIYFCRPRFGTAGGYGQASIQGGHRGLPLLSPPDPETVVMWVDEAALKERAGLTPVPSGQSLAIPEDVCLLALEAIAAERDYAGA